MNFAKKWDIDPEDAKHAPEFGSLDDSLFAPVKRLDVILAMAKEYDFIKEPLTEAQKKALIDIVYDPNKK